MGNIAEQIFDHLDGVRYGRHDADTGIFLYWAGGHGIHGLNEFGTEVLYWSVGDFANNEAALEDVEESITEAISDPEKDYLNRY